jgi:hypothetical protein|tara:strand:+ start:9197 stop:9451 length:255 start_codon:yes stop_codon:yes gene_type:complete
MITIIDRFRALRVEPNKHVTWSVGDAVANKYVDVYGHQPPKVLRPKTNARGSHCFALYPPKWIPIIDRIILAHGVEAQRQGELF